MKAQSVALAIAALWLIPSVSLAQGNSGKSRVTICHVSSGKPDAGRTLTISESAWPAHEAHGDFLGPCDGYVDGHGDKSGADAKRAKKSKQKKGRKEQRGGSDRDVEEDEIGVGDRAGEDRDIDEADRSAERERRHAERRDRERRARDQADPRAEDGQAAETTASDAAKAATDEAKAATDAAKAATDDAEAAEARSARKARAGSRNPRGTPSGAETDGAPETERGFFRGMQQFFGFGADEAAQSGADEPSGDAAE